MQTTASANVERNRNYMDRVSKCMNCGVEIERGSDIYSRRFCSEACREEYLVG